MTTFNFTVRATDDRGAFADRDFSIKVRNTIIDRYMAMSTAGLYTSPDAVTWTLRPGIGYSSSAAVNGQTEIVNGNGRWIMAKDSVNYLMSLDGVNWAPYPVPASVPFFTAGGITRFSYGNGKFMCAMVSNPSGANYVHKVYSSTDGISWTTMFPTASAGGFAGALAISGNISSYATPTPPPVYGNGRWIVANPLTLTQLITSTDNMATYTTYTGPHASGCSQIIYVNGLWIATANTGCAVATSVDGVVWSMQVLPAGYTDGNHRISKILYGNGRIVLVPSHHNSVNGVAPETSFVFTSVDGVSFTKVNTSVIFSPFNGAVQSATGTFHNGLFIIGSTGGTSSQQGIITSEDGLTWTRNTGIAATVGIGSMGSINQD